jgi:hypothetical protein
VVVSSIKIDISFIIVCHFEYFFLDGTRNVETLAAVILINVKNKVVIGKGVSFHGSAGFT